MQQSINQQLKGRQILEEQVIGIYNRLNELAKEVEGVRPGVGDKEFDYEMQKTPKQKLATL